MVLLEKKTMSERRLNKAHDVFEMWHKKNPRTHLSKDLSGTPQDFEEYMCCVGHADEIIYDSDKWEKDKDFHSYIHDFTSHPKVYFPQSHCDPNLIIGRPRKTVSFLDISSLEQPLVVAQLAFANELVFKNKDKEEVFLDLGKRKSPCFSTNDLKTVIILSTDGPIFISGSRMKVTKAGIVR